MTYVLLTIAYVVSVLISRIGMRKLTRVVHAEPTLVDVFITFVPVVNLVLPGGMLIQYVDGGNFAKKYFGIKER